MNLNIKYILIISLYFPVSIIVHMESYTSYMTAKRLIRENINKIKIYECCRNKECVNQIEIWNNCNNFSDGKRFYAKQDYDYEKFNIDVVILESDSNSGSPCAIIEILDPSRTKTCDTLELYRVFNIGVSFNSRDIIAVTSEEVLNRQQETPDANIWLLQNHLNYQTCKDCFLKLLAK